MAGKMLQLAITSMLTKVRHRAKTGYLLKPMCNKPWSISGKQTKYLCNSKCLHMETGTKSPISTKSTQMLRKTDRVKTKSKRGSLLTKIINKSKPLKLKIHLIKDSSKKFKIIEGKSWWQKWHTSQVISILLLMMPRLLPDCTAKYRIQVYHTATIISLCRVCARIRTDQRCLRTEILKVPKENKKLNTMVQFAVAREKRMDIKHPWRWSNLTKAIIICLRKPRKLLQRKGTHYLLDLL